MRVIFPIPKGRSLHAGYFASWDAATMDAIVACNREAWRSCEFLESLPDGRVSGRGQLPDRLLAPDGSPVYRYSTVLLPQIDRTPFGTALGPMRQ